MYSLLHKCTQESCPGFQILDRFKHKTMLLRGTYGGAGDKKASMNKLIYKRNNEHYYLF